MKRNSGSTHIFLLLLIGCVISLPLSANPRRVRVGVFQAAPLVLLKEGKPSGLFIDLVEDFARSFDWRIEYVSGTWSELLASLEKGFIDLLPAVGVTDERQIIYSFSRNPVYIDSGVLFASKRLTLHTVFDLEGKRVAGVRGSIFTTGFIEYIKSFNINCEIIYTNDNREVMEAISHGNADAGVCIYSLGNELAREYSIPITPISFSPIALGFAVPKDRNADLIAGIDERMSAMIGDSESLYSKSFVKWTSPPESRQLPEWLLWCFLGAGCFVLFLGLWSVSLKRQVGIKTRHLENEIMVRKQVEEEVRNLNAELEKRVAERTSQLQNANEELESFTYSVAHDLRTPLRAISNYAQILSERCEDKLNDENRRMMERVVDNTYRMDRLITGILSLSHVVRSNLIFGDVDMATLARSVFQDITTKENLEQFYFNVSALPDCRGDPTLLRQVWANLLDNAVKYTKPNAVRSIQVEGHTENGMNVYSVKDSGVGFDAQYSSKLFGVFQRLHTDKDFEGTGIGLSIVARIVHRHGGKVWAEGEVGKGATFFFSIPAGN